MVEMVFYNQARATPGHTKNNRGAYTGLRMDRYLHVGSNYRVLRIVGTGSLSASAGA